MNRIICLCLTLGFVTILSGNESDLMRESGSIGCTLVSPGTHRIELFLGSYGCDDKGTLSLDPALEKYVVTKRGLPVLLLHLAIGSDAELTLSAQYEHTPTSLDPSRYGTLPEFHAWLGNPYTLRDLRGIEVFLNPFCLIGGRIVAAQRMAVTISELPGPNQACHPQNPAVSLNPYFNDIYRLHFLNYPLLQSQLGEFGSLAVISPPEFIDLVTPWVEWKNQKGIPATIYSTAQTGNSYASIKTFIQTLYDADETLTFVQIAGDYAQVPCLVSGQGNHYTGRDADYSLLDGEDYYPDIFVGRFSAETPEELYTQIQRSIEYERDLQTGYWLDEATVSCSNNPPIPGDDDEYNWTHLDKIRGQLLDFTYEAVDRVFANEGATTADLVSSLNGGKSLLMYCGEGYPDHWLAPEFDVSDASSLVNDGMLPFVHSVSCYVGSFWNTTCLAEAFMRARDSSGEQARGAIAVYASAPPQDVDASMEGQDGMIEMLINGSSNTIGGLCYNGCHSMIDEYGLTGFGRFHGWNLFGDASLVLRTKPADEISAEFNQQILPGSTQLTIQAGKPNALACLSRENQVLASGFTDAGGYISLEWSDPVVSGERYLLTLSGFNLKTVQRFLYCFPEDGIGMELLVGETAEPVQSGQLVEKSITVRNIGSHPALDCQINLVATEGEIIPITENQSLGTMLPGEQRPASLSFQISKLVPDLALADYQIILSAVGYAMPVNCWEQVHAPLVALTGCASYPQNNWHKPGDDFQLSYRVENLGSGILRIQSNSLNTSSPMLEIDVPVLGELNVPNGESAEFEFSLRLDPSCQPGTLIPVTLNMACHNAPDKALTLQWLVVAPDGAMESFETSPACSFPWQGNPNLWQNSQIAWDGYNSLEPAPSAESDSICLELEMLNLEPGYLSFAWQNPPANDPDLWYCFLNGALLCGPETSSHWQQKTIPLNAGRNAIAFAVKPGGPEPGFRLDAIQFPARTVFDNAELQAVQAELSLRIGPGEILRLPVDLVSRDGKYAAYAAVLQNADLKADQISLACANASFTPGSSESYLFTLSNCEPAGMITGLSIGLPGGAVPTVAGAFGMPGASGLPFTGYLGGIANLKWENPAGTYAPELRTVVRIQTDAGLRDLDLPYAVDIVDAWGEPAQISGTITIGSGEAEDEFLALENSRGEICDTMPGALVLVANQNLMADPQASYLLKVFYNESGVLSIPVQVAYDPDPPGFWDTLKLAGYPNPASTSATVAFSVPAKTEVDLSVYNLRGQLIRTLARGGMEKGYYRLGWDLRDESGTAAASGIYLLRLKAGGMQKRIKVTILK